MKSCKNAFVFEVPKLLILFKQVFVRLDTKEQILINVILDTMVMELHVLSVALTRLHQQVVVLQLQQIVSWLVLVDPVSFSVHKMFKLMSKTTPEVLQLQQIVSWLMLWYLKYLVLHYSVHNRCLWEIGCPKEIRKLQKCWYWILWWSTYMYYLWHSQDFYTFRCLCCNWLTDCKLIYRFAVHQVWYFKISKIYV